MSDNNKTERLAWEDRLVSVMRKTGWDYDEAKAAMIKAHEEIGVSWWDYDQFGYYQMTPRKQKEFYRKTVERRQGRLSKNERAIKALMRIKGCDYETAKNELLEAFEKRNIPYDLYMDYRMYELTKEQQSIIYNRCINIQERKSREARHKYVQQMIEDAALQGAQVIDKDEFEEKNKDFRYRDRFGERQPDGIIASCYYLGCPLPSNASGEYQPSVYLSPIDGSFEAIRERLGETLIPDTAEYENTYYSFRRKFLNMRNLKFNETDLAIFYTDWLLHGKDYGYRNTDYFDFDFYKSDFETRKSFISTRRYKRYVRQICIKDINLFKDKGNFNRKFSEVIRRDWVDTTICSFDEFKQFVDRNPEFFAKPIRGTGGVGAAVIHSEEYTIEELFKICQERGYIAEERVKQHKELEAFNKDSLNTIRVYALLDIDEVAHITGVFARFGRVGANVDNFHKGGVGAAVDPETGVITTDAVNIIGESVEYHPDSGLRFKGFQIPEYEKLKKTVAKACSICKDINRHVGWDIAIREDGEIEVIEGNATPNFDFLQAVDKIGKYHIYDKYLTPMAKEAGVPVFHVQSPALDVTNMQRPPIKFV